MTDQTTAEHLLTIRADGNWDCSCGRWGSGRLGALCEEYSIKNNITERVVRRWHASHANAIRIELI